MAATLLTSQMVTRRALAILHNKLNFIGTINRQFDSSFGKEGAKIGNQLKVRLPNQYVTRTGQVANIQPTQENYVQLVVATQKGVDVDFTSQDLTLSIDDFSERILEPAMAQLASSIEADVFTVANKVYQQYGSAATLSTFASSPLSYFLQAKAILNKSLTPKDAKRYANINSITMAALVDGLKGLFQDASSIAEQYLEGIVGRTSGLTFLENELVPTHTNAAWSGTPVVASANQTGTSLATSGWTATTDAIYAGTIFTVPGCYMVHPETKVAYPSLQQFVCTTTTFADGAGLISIPISPAIIPVGGVAGTYSAAMANVSASPTNGQPLSIVGTTGLSYINNLVYHKDFATFVTADLYMPKGGMEMAAREMYDGISMRFLKGFDIINDIQISRFDVLYGYQAIRPQLACRIAVQN